ncbi:hypothetical protein ACSVC9_04615 [Clostridium sp. LBM24168]
MGSVFAGNDLTVLVRGKRFKELKSNGIVLVNSKIQKVDQITVNVIDTLLSNAEYDYIFVLL